MIRSGLLSAPAAYDEIRSGIAADHPSLDADALARQWVDDETSCWREDSASWPAVTDHDRLQSALGELAGRGFVVLHGCADHWAARDALRERPGAAGAIWFTAADVWHAVDEPMLELNVWHADTANAAPGDPVLDEVLSVLAAHSLPAHFDEGRVEIAIRWERRPV